MQTEEAGKLKLAQSTSRVYTPTHIQYRRTPALSNNCQSWNVKAVAAKDQYRLKY